MAAFGEIVDGIAHELRNPLMTIGGLARRLEGGEVSGLDRIDEYAERITEPASSGWSGWSRGSPTLRMCWLQRGSPES